MTLLCNYVFQGYHLVSPGLSTKINLGFDQLYA